MSSTKDHMMQVQEERFESWAAENHPEVQPDTEEWEAIAQIFADWQDFLADQAHEDYQQEKWSASLNSVEDRCQHAFSELNTLRGLNLAFQPDIVLRMVWVHSVSVMEAYLMYCARALLNHEPHLQLFRTNEQSLGFRDSELKLLRSSSSPQAPADAYRRAANQLVSRITFHNVKRIERYFSAALHYPPQWPTDRLRHIVEVRHDLVHRNGISEYDTETVVGRFQLGAALKDITTFLEAFCETMIAETEGYGKNNNGI
ncbi:hypothetical protein CIL06_21685 [Pantoea vagans]|uniref:hypothetical protein n=1 Tax=Pantoea vagans TaxID=470934 RepID=UPI000BACE27F|nr:hypothetical protein [Pantoea vagans]PAW33630.1 hypothetical protein CIL06_21685 [Pantoea vagans]